MTQERRQQVQYLLLKYIDGLATSREEAFLFQLLDEEPENAAWETLVEELMAAEEPAVAYSREDWLPVIDGILQRKKGLVKGMGRPVKWMVAAAVLVIIGLGGYWLVMDKPDDKVVKTIVPAAVEIQPGHDGAILTLSNGQQIILDSAVNGHLIDQGTVRVSKQGGQLVYESSAPRNDGSIAYNTVATPRGRIFQLVLTDGTQVWLNSGSSITYPTDFVGDERKVTITGEAYFEVARDEKKPFLVTANKMTVQVLGTHFNVMAYADEAAIKTTLVEGSVKVSVSDGQSSLLKPGYQAIISDGGGLRIDQSADIEEALAWKNGKFHFVQGTNITTIMRQVSRWYDVDVEYQGDVSKLDFSGKMSRKEQVSKLLEILKTTGTVDFAIENKKIIVIPK